jgi:uncharacterized protein
LSSAETSKIDPENSPRGPRLQIGTPAGFEWNRYQLPVAGLPPVLEGLKIVHLTDLHIRTPWSAAYDELVQRVGDAHADLVLITGDIVEGLFDYRKNIPNAGRVLSRLSARLGVFAILGNHDGDLLAPHLLPWGVQFLGGRRLVMQTDEAAIELIGLPGVYRGEVVAPFVRKIPPRQKNLLRIVLAHYPDQSRTVKSLEPDLILAGHTHGGQICLPGGTAIMHRDSLPRRFGKGVHRIGRDQKTWLVVGRGFGFTKMRVRTFCPSEVIELRLSGQNRGHFGT